ncbi:MAG: RsmE family RNA methyltransferase, partial [Deltaproteobacteria bacterium]|nr:RsmE family RNA methyltransferase [Deltaproteobacteria bacterium]
AAGDPLVLLVGPEGGLTDAELALAEVHGFSRATLFEHVLRTELAAVAAVATALAVTRSR